MEIRIRAHTHTHTHIDAHTNSPHTLQTTNSSAATGGSSHKASPAPALPDAHLQSSTCATTISLFYFPLAQSLHIAHTADK